MSTKSKTDSLEHKKNVGSIFGKLGGRSTLGEKLQQETASAIAKPSRGLIQTTLKFNNDLTFTHSSIKKSTVGSGGLGTIGGGGSITVNATTVNVYNGPVVNKDPETIFVTDEKEKTDKDDIIILEDDKSKSPSKVGEKRPRSSGDSSTFEAVRDRLALEGKVASQTGFDSYDHHRKDIKEKLEKEVDIKRRLDLMDQLEKIKITWKNTCPELMEDEASVDEEQNEEVEEISSTSADAKKVTVNGKSIKFIRHTYSTSAKQQCVDYYNECMASGGSIKSLTRVTEEINKWSGFEKVTRTSLKEWIKPGGTVQKPHGGGPRVNTDFDKAVLSKLVYTMKINQQEEAVLANICFSHTIIQQAAKQTRMEAPWKDDEKLPTTFSTSWSTRFLSDMRMTKRRITNIIKTNLPNDDQVRLAMSKIHDKFRKGGWKLGDVGPVESYKLKNVINCDETATHYSEQFQHQWVPSGTDRGSATAADEMKRFTTLVGGSAVGVMLPLFIIGKCDVTQDPKSSNFGDLTSSTLLSTLTKSIHGFRDVDGWKKEVWSKALTANVKIDGKTVLRQVTYKRPYLIHTNGNVLTVHNSAWMDTAGLCMWAELVLKPWSKGERLLLVWDNCRAHNTVEVENCFKELGIELAQLPPNMTDKLQPMDLVVNGPLKASMRRARGQQSYEYMQTWKLNADKALKEGKSIPTFSPPLPKFCDGLNILFDTTRELFAKESFVSGLQRCFIKVGLVPNPEDGLFKTWKGRHDVVKLSDAEQVEKIHGKDEYHKPSLGSLAFECLVTRTEEQQCENDGEDGLFSV